MLGESKGITLTVTEIFDAIETEQEFEVVTDILQRLGVIACCPDCGGLVDRAELECLICGASLQLQATETEDLPDA